MKNKKVVTYGKNIGLIILITFLFSFSTRRNEARKISQVQVEFVEEQNPYINEQSVNKLLIQNPEQVTSVGKEILDLNVVEERLDSHKMVENSDVYLTVSGRFRAKIRQRTPIARVNSVPPFYVDVSGNLMPLSDNYAAHVPIVYNVSEREILEVFPLLKKIKDDDFLKKHIISVTRNGHKNYEVRSRVYDFVLDFGKIKNLDLKVKNFKAFYQKAMKDKTLKRYKKVSLKFDNQVVCTTHAAYRMAD